MVLRVVLGDDVGVVDRVVDCVVVYVEVPVVDNDVVGVVDVVGLVVLLVVRVDDGDVVKVLVGLVDVVKLVVPLDVGEEVLEEVNVDV